MCQKTEPWRIHGGKNLALLARNTVIKDIEFNDAFKLPNMEDPLKCPAAH